MRSAHAGCQRVTTGGSFFVGTQGKVVPNIRHRLHEALAEDSSPHIKTYLPRPRKAFCSIFISRARKDDSGKLGKALACHSFRETAGSVRRAEARQHAGDTRRIIRLLQPPQPPALPSQPESSEKDVCLLGRVISSEPARPAACAACFTKKLLFELGDEVFVRALGLHVGDAGIE